MINFDDVRLEKNLTYLFISNTEIHDVNWCFEKADISNYEIISVEKLKENKPKELVIPNFVPLVATLDNSVTRPCKRPFVIISHMNTNDLLQKIVEINSGNDADLKEKFKKERKRISR